MIGSHDTFTYLPARNSIVNSFSGFWRCQDLSVVEQYKLGVRYFDIRVKREISDIGKTSWRCCHGKAEFDRVFSSLKSICVYFSVSLKGCLIRLVLEKEDSSTDKDEFYSQLNELLPVYGGKTIGMAGHRHPDWTMTYVWSSHPQFVDYTFEDWGFKTIATNIFGGTPIKDNAYKNPIITQEMIDDKKKIYMLDYIGLIK